MSTSSTIKQNILHMYKNMMKLVRFVPANKRYAMLNQIRTEFRSNASETSPEKIAEMLRKVDILVKYMFALLKITCRSMWQFYIFMYFT